ncbi:pentatricopeptide repeat-containing protein At1g71060, mitochondrial [Amborella trichopoda]|nr:pentatricopeptide repeat-containing protein At1g71060, mitochondrial [Amborella trichopoda]|eukprot:XP_006837175.2 pentatricopeptide repeat-containing protein At1g71060, mitochondrial [Amborella trichopoda]
MMRKLQFLVSLHRSIKPSFNFNSFLTLQPPPILFLTYFTHTQSSPLRDFTSSSTPSENSIKEPISAVSEEADRLCKLLYNQPPSNIGPTLQSSGHKVSPALAEHILKKFSNAGKLALLFFRWCEKQPNFKHTTETYHALIESLGKIKQFRLIHDLVHGMHKNGLLTKSTFALIWRRYARARKVKEAINSFEGLVNFGMKPDLSDFNRLLDTISKSRNVNKAQELFDEMKRRNRFEFDLKTYSILLEGWGEEKDLNKLMEVYREMLDVGLEPDVVTYGILINSLIKSRKLGDAIEKFYEMKEKNCGPSPHIYCSLINGLGPEKRLNEAIEFFKESMSDGFIPELPTYNALIGSYCWSAKFKDADQVLDEMRSCNVNPNTRTFNIILHHLIRLGMNNDAYNLFERMDVSVPGCEPDLNTYTMMVRMFCLEGKVEMALRVWRGMNSRGVLPCMHLYSALICGLCDENRLDEACKYFLEMLDMGIRPPGQMFGRLKQCLLDDGKKELALDLSLRLDRVRRIPFSGEI